VLKLAVRIGVGKSLVLMKRVENKSITARVLEVATTT